MQIEKTRLSGVMLIKMDKPFTDYRGYYKEIYNKKVYNSFNEVEFVQDDVSVSDKDVLRGIHGDEGTWKLISCLKGKFYLVVVNCDREHAQFGHTETFVLSEDNNHQILIPPKFGNGHYALKDDTIFHYKQSTYYGDYKQFTVKWNDPKLHIPWPRIDPILSVRDNTGPFMEL